MSGNASGRFQCSRKFWQGDIAILRYQFFQKRRITGQLLWWLWVLAGTNPSPTACVVIVHKWWRII